MNLKVVMLTFAGICGLGAYYATTKILKRDAPKVEMVDVLVAAKPLKMEEVIGADNVKKVQMNLAAVPGGAITNPADAEGRWVQVPMLEDEPILTQKLAEKGTPPGLRSRIPNGMFAYTLDVTDQTGVAGFIFPDYRVDVQQAVTKPNGQTEAVSILQDILVLASGTQITRPDEHTIKSATITLCVDNEQLNTIVAARAQGPLSLALRGLNDHTKVMHKPREVPPPVEEKKPEVIVVKAPDSAPPPDPAFSSPPPIAKPRFVSIHRGIENMTRIRMHRKEELEDDQELGGPDAGMQPPSEFAPSVAGAIDGKKIDP